MADVSALKVRAYDLGKALSELQKQYNEKADELKKLNEQIMKEEKVTA